MKLNFIRLENSLEKAMSYRNNPDMKFFSFYGVQLLPNDIYPYIQTTFSNDGIELEDWQVNVVSSCGEILADITDNFDVLDNFQDPDTGLPQITWSLRDLPDFGNRLLYLVVKQLNGETFYSTVFSVTDNSKEYTSRIDYRNDSSETMQSSRVSLFYRQQIPVKEYTQYYEITTKNTRTNTIKSQKPELWRTGIIPIELICLIQDVFDFREVYLDLTRAAIFEPFEIPLLEADENFSETDIKFVFVNSDVYNPNYVSVPPQPEPPIVPLIRIRDITQNLGKYGNFLVYYDVENFTPQYATLLYSIGNNEPIRNTGAVTNFPRGITLPFAQNPALTKYKIQFFQAGTGTYSNDAYVVQGLFWLLITEKISSTQYKLKIRYTVVNDQDSTAVWNVNGTNYTIPNTGMAEKIINALGGSTLTTVLSQGDAIDETITVTL